MKPDGKCQLRMLTSGCLRAEPGFQETWSHGDRPRKASWQLAISSLFQEEHNDRKTYNSLP